MADESTSIPKAELTDADVAAYIEKGAGHCPFCGDHSIEGEGVEIEATCASQEVGCYACGAAWQDVYEMKSIVVRSNPTRSSKSNEHYEYLDALRESGSVNMMGAAPHLAAEFGLDKYEARKILANWMQNFGKEKEEA